KPNAARPPATRGIASNAMIPCITRPIGRPEKKNIKSLAILMHGEGPKRMQLSVNGPCEVTAAMIETGHDI
mgnify:CR=1